MIRISFSTFFLPYTSESYYQDQYYRCLTVAAYLLCRGVIILLFQFLMCFFMLYKVQSPLHSV